ncbi:MAG: phytanoyl-CoA dioxygenase family protein [Mycobacteriaceae bacterium]
MDVTSNDKLPEANRDGGIESAWAGDDQQWWDWYVTLAANPEVAGPLVAGPGLPDVAPATDAELTAFLAEPYPLADEAVQTFADNAFVKLPGVLNAAVVRRLAERLQQLLTAEHGTDTAGRFLALEQMWCDDDLMRAVATSPRIGSLAAGLLSAEAVRIYHDNALSKEPACGRTPWHHDDEHFPLDSHQVLTAWMPMSAIPAEMGPLSFAHGSGLRELVGDLSFDKVGTSYDVAVSQRFGASGVQVTDTPYAVGEVSFHSSLCFHTAGPNRTTQPRRALATTYFADGTQVVAAPTMVSGTWQEFLPDTAPGALAQSTLNPVVGRS